MLQADGLECVRGERRLFRDLSFTLVPGTLLRVEGPNGSGKTSLLRMLCGLLIPAAGAVRWHAAFGLLAAAAIVVGVGWLASL